MKLAAIITVRTHTLTWLSHAGIRHTHVSLVKPEIVLGSVPLNELPVRKTCLRKGAGHEIDHWQECFRV